MKLGIVVPGGFGRRPEDGRIPSLNWLTERLARHHEVHVFSLLGPRQPARYRFAGADVHHVGGPWRSLRAAWAIAVEHRAGPFSLLHAFWVAPPGVIAGAMGKVLGVPVLVHVGGGELVGMADIDYGGLRSWRGRLGVGLGLKGATRVSAATAGLIESLRRHGVEAARIPLGADRGEWVPRPPRGRRAGDSARIVHVADLNAVKDQRTLLRAARILADRGASFRLDIAGRDVLRGAVQADIAALGLSERVHWHGRLPHAELVPLVAAADLLWLSSRHEAGPVVVLEAALLGVPTVGTAVGHVAEWAPEAAVAVPVADAAGLAAETERLLADEGRRRALALEAQRRAVAGDADWTAARFAALYDEIVSGANSRDRVR